MAEPEKAHFQGSLNLETPAYFEPAAKKGKTEVGIVAGYPAETYAVAVQGG